MCYGTVARGETEGPIVADGISLSPGAGTYETTADSAGGYVFHALNGGSIEAVTPVSIVAKGVSTAAVLAESKGAITLNGGEVVTSGNLAQGVSVLGRSRAVLGVDSLGEGVKIATTGHTSSAVHARESDVSIQNSVISTAGTRAYGIEAAEFATVQMSGGSITTGGLSATAVSARNARVELADVDVRTRGADGTAIAAAKSSTIEAERIAVVAEAYAGMVIDVEALSTLRLSDSSIEALSLNDGIGVRSYGNVSLHDVDVTMSGAMSSAMRLYGGSAEIENSKFTSTADRSTGIYVLESTQLNISRSAIDVLGYGLNINGKDNDVRLTDVNISTSGSSVDSLGTGIWIVGASKLDMTGGSIATRGTQDVAVDNRRGNVFLKGVQVSTAGASAHGLYASMDAGPIGPKLAVDNTNVLTTGSGSVGAIARLGGSVRLDNSSVTTQGAKAHGLIAGGSGEMTLSNTDVLTRGDGAWAAVVNSDGYLDIDGGSLISEGHGALWIRSARALAIHDGARIVGGNGTLVAVDASFATPFELSLDQDVYAQGDIVVNPDDVHDGKPILAEVNVNLKGRSHWVGSTALVNRAVMTDDSRWTLTHDSSVGQLGLTNSTLELSESGSGNFNRLDVAGDLDTRGANLIFSGALAGDSSPVDFLHVHGNTSGDATVQVRNAHGAGALTSNGIQIIQVDGRSDAEYVLGGRAVAGGYDYFLYKGGVTSPDDGGWYLRSELAPVPPDPCDDDPNGPGCVAPVPDPCDVDPSGPGCISPPIPEPCEIDPSGPGCAIPPVPEPCEVDPAGPGCAVPPVPEPCEADSNSVDCIVRPVDPCEEDPAGSGCHEPDPCETAGGGDCNRPEPPMILRPEIGAYLANQSMAASLFHHRLQDSLAVNGDRAWLRVVNTYVRQTVAGQLALRGHATTLLGGTDLLYWGEGGSVRAGLMAGAGQASTDVMSEMSGYSSVGTVKGLVIGGYLSWDKRLAGGAGAYADVWLQHGRYRNTVKGAGLDEERYEAMSSSASFDTGYSLLIRETDAARLMVEPQLQITYTSQHGESLVERNGTVVEPGGSRRVSSRLGFQVRGDIRNPQRKVSPFVSLAWLNEAGSNEVLMDGVAHRGALPRSRYEVRGGVQVQLGRRWSAWGDVSLGRGKEGYRSTSAQAGLSANW